MKPHRIARVYRNNGFWSSNELYFMVCCTRNAFIYYGGRSKYSPQERMVQHIILVWFYRLLD